MKFRIIVSVAAIAMIGSVAMASAKPKVGNAPTAAPAPWGVQLAENESPMQREKQEVWDWYQGERGHWRQDKQNSQWHWFGAKDHGAHSDKDEGKHSENNGQWYQGHRGHWMQGHHGGWHFKTPDLVCNNAGRNCRTGGYIPANGEGLVSAKNPKWFWHCDSDGHNCNWAKRPGM